MRHKKKRLQLGRFGAWRRATLKSLARSLFIHQSIRTTKSRAMAVKPLIDKLITLAKLNNLAAKRRVFKILQDHKLVNLLFNDIALRFATRQSGYTRILNLGPRRGDNAQVVLLELVEIKKKERKRLKKTKDQKLETQEATPEVIKEKPAEEKKREVKVVETEKPHNLKPPKKFLGGLRSIFKKKSDSL
jgi:large subunit ribosomal protein L17